ncbi:hypothetical protein M4I21_10430 [Cellulophaga sp. 20_2_10]|uniref:hypothetical protein n=1 Tax=Cellulophaga sp. 20_2_10 TaxID=2942476 RepID=UPI00201B12FD|nr:hypothetical protein [Cellulophaga sp. 20_2_10]MCL5246225.1 hypothetical protein [Cellulophaga sp. 20_2_10]
MKNIALLLFTLLITVCTSKAQTIEKLAENNIAKSCKCIKKIDRVTSKLDFENKIYSCSVLRKNDSIALLKITTFKEYEKFHLSKLPADCDGLEAKLEQLRQSYITTNTNSLDATQTKYETIEKSIIGSYDLSFGKKSPEGSSTLILYNQNEYVIESFDALQVGTWQVVQGKYLHLFPNKSKSPLTIYGRHNPNIGDSTYTSFLGDRFSYKTLITYKEPSKSPISLSPIFNKDANCFNFPYIHKTSGKPDQISLAYNQNYEESENQEITLYTFKNSKNFNDFIIFEHTRNLDGMPADILIGDNKLIFDEDSIAVKYSSHEENTVDATNSRFIFYNSGYKIFKSELINSKQYNYNKKDNNYLYDKSLETTYEPDISDYHNYYQVNKYEKLQDLTKEQKQFTIAKKSIIYTVCD